jgi:hypothetical protein
MITRPIVFCGSSLRLNFSTSAAGSVHAEIQDPAGRAVEGFELENCRQVFGDAIDRQVRWKTDSRPLPAGPSACGWRFARRTCTRFASPMAENKPL